METKKTKFIHFIGIDVSKNKIDVWLCAKFGAVFTNITRLSIYVLSSVIKVEECDATGDDMKVNSQVQKNSKKTKATIKAAFLSK